MDGQLLLLHNKQPIASLTALAATAMADSLQHAPSETSQFDAKLRPSSSSPASTH